MRIAAALFRGFAFSRLDARRSPLFAHCQRRYRSQPEAADGAPAPATEPKDADETAKA
jgi:hypothetical protein